MSEAKHTPGPWTMSAKQFVDGHGYTGHIIRANSIWIGDVHGLHVGVPENEIEANAKLIAAAPDLLEALEPFAKFACDEPCGCNNCRARAAVSKATS